MMYNSDERASRLQLLLFTGLHKLPVPLSLLRTLICTWIFCWAENNLNESFSRWTNSEEQCKQLQISWKCLRSKVVEKSRNRVETRELSRRKTNLICEEQAKGRRRAKTCPVAYGPHNKFVFLQLSAGVSLCSSSSRCICDCQRFGRANESQNYSRTRNFILVFILILKSQPYSQADHQTQIQTEGRESLEMVFISCLFRWNMVFIHNRKLPNGNSSVIENLCWNKYNPICCWGKWAMGRKFEVFCSPGALVLCSGPSLRCHVCPEVWEVAVGLAGSGLVCKLWFMWVKILVKESGEMAKSRASC